MFGINVAASIDKLRAALHDGGLGRLLFPTDPVANAPAIIATMVAGIPSPSGRRHRWADAAARAGAGHNPS